MAIFNNSIIKYFTAGGDLLWHQIQLVLSNLMRVVLIGALTFLISWLVLLVTFTGSTGFAFYFKLQWAKLMILFPSRENVLTLYSDDGSSKTMSAHSVIYYSNHEPGCMAAVSDAHFYAFVGLIVAAVVSSIAIIYNIKKGRQAGKDIFLRGQKILSKDDLKKFVGEDAPVHLAGIPIVTRLLARNILCVGSMGTGKSEGIFEILDDVRTWKKKCIIYDKTGEIVRKYFRPGKDILMNPVDARCADWTIFSDLKKITDPAMVSRFFVPENKKSSDPVWDNAARMLLEDVIRIVAEKKGTMNDVRKIVTELPLDELHELLSKHGASSVGIINPSNEKGSESIRLTLTAQPAIRFFSFFDNRSASFSVRDFVSRDDDACLFLVSNSTQHEAVKPFISAWIELALTEAMSLRPTTDIRLFFILDELASLSKLNSLQIAMTEARQFGIATVVGIQNLSQLDEIYGEDLTKVLVANMQTKLILRTEEETSAKRLADTLGKEEIKEIDESKSFGVESNRDGVSISSKRAERNLVTPTEILILPDLTGYLKIAGAHPIAKVELKYKERPLWNEAFIEREGLDLVIPDVLEEDLEIARDQSHCDESHSIYEHNDVNW